MNRRDFLLISAALTASTYAKFVNGTPSKNAAAVVIGVDKPNNLPPLKGAISGAQSVASWLSANGFEVKLFVDKSGPVTISDIYKAVEELVKRGTLDQMVVYFAGHGFIGSYAEFWMLSGAPENPNEAISLRESIELARISGIPNIVFISDACRSRPDSLQAQFVRGSLIFPTRPIVGTRTVVDVFLATGIGDPSMEVSLDQSTQNFGGIYTTVFLSAYEHPDDEMVVTLDGLRVIPNNRLKPYLEREVTRRAEALSLRRQVPDSQILSDDKTYISSVSSAKTAPVKSVSSTPTFKDVAAAELKDVGVRGVGDSFRFRGDEFMMMGQNSSYLKSRDVILQAFQNNARLQRHGLQDLDTGFTVTGTRIELADSNPQIHAQIVSNGDNNDGIGIIRVDMRNDRAGSIILRFADGSGTVIAALKGYIGNIIVDHVGIANVRYVPSRSAGWIWGEYNSDPERIDRLHAAVATAARFGVFRVDLSKAEQLADTIRVGKMIDPTLGIYAAYAYADAGLERQVESVGRYLHGDLGADIFDVAMLSRKLSGHSPKDDKGGEGTVPFCPMLSQGWGYLRVRNVRVTPEIDKAQDHLRPSLWTTFDSKGVELLVEALHNGKLL